jgi:hypothetical protein
MNFSREEPHNSKVNISSTSINPEPRFGRHERSPLGRRGYWFTSTTRRREIGFAASSRLEGKEGGVQRHRRMPIPFSLLRDLGSTIIVTIFPGQRKIRSRVGRRWRSLICTT